MKIKNLIYTALMVALFVEILVVFPKHLEQSRKEEEAEQKRISIEDNAAEQTMKGVHLVESQAGVRDWELTAGVAEGGKSTGSWSLRDIKITFYSKDIAQYVVTGQQGSIDGERRNVRIRGNVVTTSSNGYVFRTDSVDYIAKTREIKSDSKVEMRGPADSSGDGLSLLGSALNISVDQKIMRISGPVESRRALKDGKQLSVAAGSALFSAENNEAQFSGQVVLNYDQMRLEGPEAFFFYQKSKSLLSGIELKGGVTASDAEKTAAAERVVLDLLTQKYTFKGSPKVQQGEDELQGDEIVFLEGGKKVKVERLRARMENK